MLVMFRSTLRRPAELPPAEFYAAWLEEARGTLAARDAGVVTAVWKVAGRDEVIGVLDVPDGEALDRAVNGLPLWRRGYSHLVVDTQWTVLRSYDGWAADLERLAAGEAP